MLGSRSTTPAQAVSAIIERLSAGGIEDPVVVMVGDGATDLEAKPPAKAVIGFGGVVTREVVREKSDWFVKDFAEVTEIVASNSGWNKVILDEIKWFWIKEVLSSIILHDRVLMQKHDADDMDVIGK